MADPAKEHLMLCKVLDAKLEPPSPDLVELAAELAGEGIKQLNVDMVERVLMAKLSARTLLADRLKYLQDCNKICDEVRRDAKFPPPVLAQLPKVVQLMGNYAALSITTAELFGAESAPPEQAAATLQAMWERTEISFALLLRIAEAMKEMEEDDQLSLVFGPLLTAVCQRLQGRDLADQKLVELSAITQVCSSKGPLTRLLVQLPVFRPPPSAAPPPPMFPGMAPNAAQTKPGEGFRLQTESLLGWVLSPTCLDTKMHQEGKSCRHMHFQNIMRKSQPQVASSQSLLRSNLSSVLEQAGRIINPLLHKSSGEETRRAVLEWFGAVITGTEGRTQGANQIDEGGGPNHFIETMENSPLPMHQNLDMRLQMQVMKARMHGFATPGLAVNIFWCLTELVKPIKFAQAVDLDPFYILREEPQHAAILGGFKKETRFGDEDEVKGSTELARAEGKLDAVPKSFAQIFWLAMRAVHVLFVPVMKEDFCYAVAASHFQGKDMTKMEQALGEHFLLECILEGSAFLQNLGALLNLEIVFLLSAAFPERAKDIADMKFGASILAEEVSSQWFALPACILEDIVEILDYYTQIRTSDNRSSDVFSCMKPELLLFLVTFMLGSGDHIKNPNLRGKAATILMSLAKQPEYLRLLETNPVLSGDILPACVRVFTAVEKTKSSYFDIRMQLKYQLRIPIMELFEKVLPLERHKQALKSFAADHSDEFMKFLNQLMNDATMQLEEGMDTLLKVRELQKEGGQAASSRPPAESVDQDEQNAEGRDIYRQSREDPKEHCKLYMKMGNRTIRTLWNISREAPDVIVSKLNVLQQLLHNCLNACLDRLVGPRCMGLKGESKDFETFNFHPKELLQFIAEMYVFVARADKERVQKMVTEDGRSYQPATFTKAVRILRRERMIASNMLTEFEQFVNDLNALAASQEAALANVEVPDHYLDPIMQEIMEDPVLLPTSKNIMDRKVIERHIMSNDDDPFNRQALAVHQLEPQTELRDEIRAFCAKHGIALGES